MRTGIITLRDGRVVEESGHRATGESSPRQSQSEAPARPHEGQGDGGKQAVSPPGPMRRAPVGRPRREPGLGSLPWEAGRMAPARHAGPPHAHLTMLGIIIGTPPWSAWWRWVRARAKVIDDINAMGTTIDIFPGKDWGRESRQHPDPE